MIGPRWRRYLGELGGFLRNRAAMAGVGLLLGFIALAVAHPVLLGTVWADRPGVYHPEYGYELTGFNPSGPSSRHLLGTDPLGRDVLSLVTYGTGHTLALAITAALTVGLAAIAAGAVGAYWRGPLDAAFSHLSDALLLFPAPIAMIIFGFIRPDMSPYLFGLLYGLLYGLGGGAVVIRSHALTVMAKPFIAAARVAGGGPWRIIRVHLLPHLLPLAAIQMMLAVTGAVVVEGFVEFLHPGEARIGYGFLLYNGLTFQSALMTGPAWSTLLAGALAISFLCAAFYLISVGLRQVVDPTLKREWLRSPASSVEG